MALLFGANRLFSGAGRASFTTRGGSSWMCRMAMTPSATVDNANNAATLGHIHFTPVCRAASGTTTPVVEQESRFAYIAQAVLRVPIKASREELAKFAGDALQVQGLFQHLA